MTNNRRYETHKSTAVGRALTIERRTIRANKARGQVA